MDHSNNLKKTEKKVLIFLLSLLSYIKKAFIFLIDVLAKIIRQKITIMFIPHSEKKVFNFRINLFILFVVPFFATLIFIFITFFSLNYFSQEKKYNDANKQIQSNLKRAREYEELINEIIENHEYFEDKLNRLLVQLNLNLDIVNQGQGGPLNAVDITGRKFEEDKSQINKIFLDYQYSIQAFDELNKLASVYNKLLKDMPFGSPAKGPYAITSSFGLRIHPIYKILETHLGLDMAGAPGTQIVATAPGIVEKVEWNPLNYGWYCKISHGDMGFSTLYAHLRSQPVVQPGDTIVKGQLIGYMGATGATTGNHLHYEVRLGDRLLDPMKFVSTY